jgi:plastocyanin
MRKLLVLGSMVSGLVLMGAGCSANKVPAEPVQNNVPAESSPQAAALPESQSTEPAPQTPAPASVTPKPSTPAPAATPAPTPAVSTPASAPVTTQPETREIAIASFAFSPASVTVKAGTTIKWTNNDSAPHSIASSDGKFTGSSVLSKGNAYQFTFDKPGTYNYICGIHPSMSGTIIVQ